MPDLAWFLEHSEKPVTEALERVDEPDAAEDELEDE